MSDKIHCFAEYPECKPTEFRCENRRCIPLEYVCDRDDDCRDGSDEVACEVKCDGPNEFSCDDGTMCLNEDLRCNNWNDCKDESDELNCGEWILTEHCLIKFYFVLHWN